MAAILRSFLLLLSSSLIAEICFVSHKMYNKKNTKRKSRKKFAEAIYIGSRSNEKKENQEKKEQFASCLKPNKANMEKSVFHEQQQQQKKNLLTKQQMIRLKDWLLLKFSAHYQKKKENI